MTYSENEIKNFENRWNDYIDGMSRLKLSVPAAEMDRVTEAQDELRAAVENAVESFEAENEN